MYRYILITSFFVTAFNARAQSLPGDTTQQTHHKKHSKNDEQILENSANYRGINSLEEGYTALSGGRYIIKDSIVKGKLNLICITTGLAIASSNINSGKAEKRYYLQKGEDKNSLREVYLTKKNKGTVGKILVQTTQLDRGMLNKPKLTGGIAISQAILKEMMADQPQMIPEIEQIEQVNVGNLKKLIKAYNAL